MIQLRDYQARAVDEVLAHLDDRPILQMATGAGKTVCAVEIIRRSASTVLVVAHRRELIAQTAAHLVKYDVKCGIIQSGFPEHRSLPVQVASVQTLARRDAPHADLIIVDECHHVTNANTYSRILSQYPHAKLLGLSATPQRLDGRSLGSMFGRIISGPSTRSLCDDGTLIAPIVYAPPAEDMSNVKMIAGDYSLEQAAQKYDKPKLVGNIVETWLKHGAGRRTIAFATNRIHSLHIAERFRESGVSAEHLDGTASALERAAALRRWRTGETTVISNCSLFSEGFDLPSLEVAIIARPTASLVWHLQAIGRVMRAADGKAGALVLDHVSNSHRHGLVTDDRTWTLDDTQRRKRTDGEKPLRTCKQCYLVVPAGCHQCPGCGYQFQVETTIPKEAEGTLVPFAVRQSYWEQCEAQRVAFHYKEGYSAAKYHSRFGVWPDTEKGQLAATVTDGVRREEFARLAAIGRRKGFAEGWAKHIFRSKFKRWPSREEMMGA